MSEVEISVGGRKYTIACNSGEENDVLIASQDLDKEARNIVQSIGKVSDIKLLLMAGLMIAGRLKIIEKDVSLKSKEISELENSVLSLKEELQRLEKIKNNSQTEEREEVHNTNMDENSFEKILISINHRLNSLVQDKNEQNVKDKELVNSDKTKEINSDQQELF